MESLTLELDHILLHLSVDEILKICRLNKGYQSYCNSRQHYRLWRAILVGDFYPVMDVDTIKRRWRQEEINSLELFVEAYRKEYENVLIRQPGFPQIGCIVAISLKGDLNRPYFRNYPAVNQWKSKRQRRRFDFEPRVPSMVEIYYDDDDDQNKAVVSSSETLIIRILLEYGDTIVYDAFQELNWNVDYILEQCDEFENLTLNSGDLVIEAVCIPHISREFVELGSFKVVNFVFDSRKIKLTDLKQNNVERERLYGEFVSRTIESKVIARTSSPNSICIHSHDEKNFNCSVGDCEHKMPLEYLKWWIEEEQSIECRNICPRCE